MRSSRNRRATNDASRRAAFQRYYRATKLIRDEAQRPDHASVLLYASDCIGQLAKLVEMEDACETAVARANMRTLSRRLASFAKAQRTVRNGRPA